MGIKLGPLYLKNPVLVASGTFGFGLEYADLVDLSLLGALVTKTVTIKPRKGNPQPRLIEVEGGLVNSIGLQNDGIDNFILKYLPQLLHAKADVIVNIAGETIDEYGEAAIALKNVKGIKAIEVNISCPNVEKGCMLFGKDPELTARVIKIVRSNTELPVIAKLTPNTDDIVLIAKAAISSGADIISMINTVQTTVNIPGTSRSLTAGLSGPAIKYKALELIESVRENIKAPIIGMGGIMGTEDARDFLKAGADAIAVGTANFIDPSTALKIINDLGY